MSRLSRLQQTSTTVWVNNPSLVLLMGLSPLLAVSHTAVAATALALGTCLVCLLSALTVYALRNQIEERYAYLWVTAILASYTSLICLLMEIWFYPLYREIGVYSYLIACNFALLVKLPSYLHSNSKLSTIIDAGKLALALAWALIGFATLREFLISGTVFANMHLLLPGYLESDPALFDNNWFKFIGLQPGAFILLGLIIAACNALGISRPEAFYHRDEGPVKRERVTGRLKSNRN